MGNPSQPFNPDGTPNPDYDPTAGDAKQARLEDIGGGVFFDPNTGTYFKQGINPITGRPETRIATPQDIAEIQRSQGREDRALRGTPTSSFNVSQSLADDRSIQIQLLGAQDDIRRTDAYIADLEADRAFAREKLAIETEAGQRAEARATQALLESIQSRIESNNIRREQMAQELRQFERRMAFEQAVEANRRQVEARNQQRADIEQRRGIARDIGQFAQNPGDVGANAAFLTAGGADPISRAIASGQSGLTDQSLAPLDMLLAAQQMLNGTGLLNGVMQQAEQPDTHGFGGFLTGSPEEAAARQASLDAQLQGQLGAILTGNPSTVAAGTPIFESLSRLAGTEGSAIQQDGGQFSARPGTEASRGGFQGAVRQSAARTPELEEMERMTGLVFAADGFNGVVNQPTTFVAGEGGQPESVSIQPIEEIQQPQAPSRARDFLNRSLQLALQNSPFGGVPTPVGVSAPGTSPFLQQMAASIAALRGISPQLFFNELMRVQPTGISEGVTRRT